MFARIIKLQHYFSRRQTPTLNWVTINRGAIWHNYNVFRGMLRESDVLIPVLKSNAYGHGLREVSQAVAMIKTVSMVAVDNYPETQQILHYTKLDVLMMGEAHVDRYRSIDHRRVHMAVYTKEIVTELVRLGKPCRIHLFLNTGLNREGIQEADLSDILSLIRGSNLIVEGVMSHFACDDEPDGEQVSLEQIIVFKRMYDVILSYGFSPQYRHINNTSGIIRFADPWFNAHRLGKGLYGFTSQKVEHVAKGNKSQQEVALQMVADVYSTVISTQQIQV
jgi:alanine racemase